MLQRKSQRDKRKQKLIDKETKAEQMKLYKAIKVINYRLDKCFEDIT